MYLGYLSPFIVAGYAVLIPIVTAALSKLDFAKVQMKRTYCTASQVEIAKSVKEILTKDLSRRFTAKELARQFGISETALKNYFRIVYGIGYAEYQQIKRMELSARLLQETDDKIADVAMAVGYATQPKFGAAFKACYGVTPLEYRRQKRLIEWKGDENHGIRQGENIKPNDIGAEY